MKPGWTNELADCTAEAVALIRARTSAVQEFGGGDGRWARALRGAGLSVRSLDPEPTGEGVECGSHRDAAPGVDVLIVWPPDAQDVFEWVREASPALVFVCGHEGRFETRALAAHYERADRIVIEGGRKGPSGLTVWQRRIPA